MDTHATPDLPAPVEVIACGALAHEVVALIRQGNWEHVRIACLPAHLHNQPSAIPDAVREKVRDARARGCLPVVAYGDCGTGGLLDAVCNEERVERIGGAHCYAFYLGQTEFEEFSSREPACFYLTDFLARHFDTLVWRGLGLDRAPSLIRVYFRNYRKLVYLAQTENAKTLAAAQRAAELLGLAFEHRSTGYGELERFLAAAANGNRRQGLAPNLGGDL